jgi:hypothetical protein
MSLASRLAVPLFVLAPLIAAAPARADAASDAADALQQQIRAWMADLVGPSIDFGSHTVSVRPEGDGFRFDLPVAGPVGSTGWRIIADPVTAMVKPLDGGRWSIESLRMPSPMRIEQAPRPGGKLQSWTAQWAEQETHGVFDPTLATGSSYDAVLDGYSSFGRTEKGTHSTTLYRYTGHAAWQPVGDGRVTASGTGQGENLNITADIPSRPGKVTVSVATVRTNWQVERVAFDQLGTAVRNVTGLLPTAMLAAGKAGVPGSITPADRARLRDLVLALRDLLGGVQQEVTLEKLRLEAGGMSGTLDKLTIGGRAEAPDGMLDASLQLSMDGVNSSLVPDGPLRDYLPRHISLTPSISGVPAADAMALLQRAIDSDDPQSLLGEATGLLGKGPLKAGLDDVVLDLGDAVLKGSGTLTVIAADDIEGSAQVVATGLDTLIRRANTVPELHRAAPFLIFLKGIGEQKGDAITWNITYADGHTTVNGTDLTTLMPSSDSAPKRQRNRRP